MNFRIANLLIFVLVGLVLVGGAYGQFHEKFESGQASWQRHETDCPITQASWKQRRFRNPDTSNGCENIHFTSGPGTKIYLSHKVSPAFVISELNPSVRIKATRPGVQLIARIVLPHSPSPSGEGPLTTMLAGPRYEGRGRWETLSFEKKSFDLQRQLTERVWLLRRKYGSSVDQRDAYVDKLVLNLYSGPGRTAVQIDDLKLNGIVAADTLAAGVAARDSTVVQDANLQPANFEATDEKHNSLVTREGTVLLVKKRPFFPKIIQHNGESFDFLKALGFNTIELKSTATEAQLQLAQSLDLWLICPPPSSVGVQTIGLRFDRVLVWRVGEDLAAADLSSLKRKVREIRSSDRRDGRPIMAEVASDWSRLSQSVDVVTLGLNPIGTSFIASQYGDWIAARRLLVGETKPAWANIQTELPESLLTQIETLAKKTPPVPIEPQQVKFLVYEAISAGARGLRFSSRSRMDDPSPVTRLRSQTIQWVLAHVDQIEPWAVGGALMGSLDNANDELEIAVIKTNRSRLLLIERPTHHEQYLAGDLPVQPMAIKDPTANATELAYLIGDTGLQPLVKTRDISGAVIRINNCPAMMAIVLTQDPLVIKKLTSSYERVGKQSILQMHIDLTRQWLAIMQLIDKQMGRMGRSSLAGSTALNDAVNSFQNAQRFIESNNSLMAVPYLDRADERLAFVRRDMIIEPLGKFQSKTSTPFTVHSSLIPLHWELTERLSRGSWKPNGLAGGDFEDLKHMLGNGWENHREESELVSTRVELAASAAVNGRYGLKMSVLEKQPNQGVIESTPLWINSPKTLVKAGQLVRIHGWVNIPKVIRGTHDGLTITDSLGGPEMMERIPITSGWQEFTLYRAAAENESVRVTFALTGTGIAMLDEVTVRAIDLPAESVRQAKN
jgi:hypothetical protein